MAPGGRQEDEAKDLLFRFLVWSVGLLLTVSGASVAYLYQTTQSAVTARFEALEGQTAKQWEHLATLEHRLAEQEWKLGQAQADLAAMKRRP